MIKILIICTPEQVVAARQKIFYSIYSGSSSINAKTGKQFQIHFVTEMADLTNLEVDANTFPYLFLTGSKLITAPVSRLLMGVVELLTKAGATEASVELVG